MNEAYIQLVLAGPNVTVQDAKDFAKELESALAMVAMMSGGRFTITVGQITAKETAHGGQ